MFFRRRFTSTIVSPVLSKIIHLDYGAKWILDYYFSKPVLSLECLFEMILYFSKLFSRFLAFFLSFQSILLPIRQVEIRMGIKVEV